MTDGAPVSLDAVCPLPYGGGHVERHRFASGLTALILEDHRAPLAAYHTWLGTGSSAESPGHTGVAHLLEHMMFRGTTAYPAGEFDRLLEQRGAECNAATWIDWTCYHQRFGAEHLGLVMELEADRLTNLDFDDEAFRAERDVVLNERRLVVDDDPEGQLSEMLYRLAFGGEHPYGWPTIGYEDDIRRLTRKRCLAFYQRWYSPANATVVIAGSVDTADALSKLEALYPSEASEGPPRRESFSPAEPGGEATVEIDAANDRVLVAYRAPALSDPAHVAFDVLTEILFNSDSARLNEDWVYAKSFADAVSGWTTGFRHAGVFEVDVSIARGQNPQEVVPRLTDALHALATKGPTSAELQRSKSKLLSAAVRQLLSAGSIAYGLGVYETLTGDVSGFLGQARHIEGIEAEHVVEAARRVVAEGPVAVVYGRARSASAGD